MVITTLTENHKIRGNTKDFMPRLGREHLLSHCATPVFRACEGEETILKTGKGTLVIWEWLAMDRFFPPEHADSWQDVLRGSASVCTLMTLQRGYN